MIAVDTSAIIAILFSEDEAEMMDRMIAASTAIIGAPTLLEAVQVARRGYNHKGTELIDAFIKRPSVRVVPFTLDHYRLASDAFNRFGKGQGHKAQLNFGDCLAYAIAKVEDVPLLFKGTDFAATDIRPAYP